MYAIEQTSSFRLLTSEEIQFVTGGVNWRQVGAGAVAVASVVGAVAAAAATATALPALAVVGLAVIAVGGAVMIADGVING